MSYIVFARKWRPQIFDDVIDQENIVQTLKNAVNNNRLAHAYIFAGPRGVGKTSAARILAKSLNCRLGPTLNPCNKCPSCLEIAEARSLDVIEIDGASNRGIDDIRVLRENVKFSPVHGKYKIYIIDEVHQITPEGFNALLKTLEEPPEHVKFIFATTHPQKIPDTIISRCQLLEFRRISNINIIKQLKKIIQEENIKAGEDALLAIARASDGSLRDAESILDELNSFTKGRITIEDIHSVLGVVEHEYLLELTDKMIKKDASAAIELLDQLIDKGKDPGQLLISLIEHFRNLMVARVSRINSQKLLDLPKEVCEVITKQSQGLSIEEMLSAFNILAGVREISRYIDNIRIPLEVALVKLCFGKSSEAIKPAAQSLPQESKFSSQNPKAAQPPIKKIYEEKPASAPDDSKQPQIQLELEKVKRIWQDFIEEVKKVKVPAAHYLEGGLPFRALGSVLTIGFPSRLIFNKESLERKENLTILESVCKRMLNQDIKINFALIKEEIKENIPDKHDEDHAVNSVLKTFNARVVRRD